MYGERGAGIRGGGTLMTSNTDTMASSGARANELLYPVPQPSAWMRGLRIAFEFVLLFGVAVLLDEVILSDVSGPFPDALWMPVVVLALEHGMGAGLIGALLATALYYGSGLPPAVMSEDLYAYIGRIAAEPIGWTCAALLIGHVRSRQVAQRRELQAALLAEDRECAALAEHCAQLKQRSALLERQIACNAQSSDIEVAEALVALRDADQANCRERISRLVRLMFGAGEASIFLLNGNQLDLSIAPKGEDAEEMKPAIEPGDSLFTAVVEERRALMATCPADKAVLGSRFALAGPLLNQYAADRILGMLGIGGEQLAELPADAERRWTLVSMEISRLVSRLVLTGDMPARARAASNPMIEGSALTAPESDGPKSEAASNRLDLVAS